MVRAVSFLAYCFEWLKRELETPVEYDLDEEFFLLLPPAS